MVWIDPSLYNGGHNIAKQRSSQIGNLSVVIVAMLLLLYVRATGLALRSELVNLRIFLDLDVI